MVNAILFKRSVSTLKSNTTIANLDADDKVSFDTNTSVIEDNTMTFDNMITKKPSPTSDGTRLIKLQDNGISDISFTIDGFMKVYSSGSTLNTNIKKLINFAKEVQVENSSTPNANDHKFGKFGLVYPNAGSATFTGHSGYSEAATSLMGFDPTPTAGLSINQLQLTHVPASKIIKIRLQLQFGGTYLEWS